MTFPLKRRNRIEIWKHNKILIARKEQNGLALGGGLFKMSEIILTEKDLEPALKSCRKCARSKINDENDSTEKRFTT